VYTLHVYLQNVSEEEPVPYKGTVLLTGLLGACTHPSFPPPALPTYITGLMTVMLCRMVLLLAPVMLSGATDFSNTAITNYHSHQAHLRG
jgi:hypothetical protein